MKIKDLVPEINEEKFLNLLKEYSEYLATDTKHRLRQLHKELDIKYAIIAEYNLIQEKKSFLTFGQRKQIEGVVSLCLVRLAKGDESKDDLEKEIETSVFDGTNNN